ncbi:MAG: hypothetical protein NZ918_04670 [Aigarchaeota archaeon]|nr:hypothetical protein [Aigarchaeota archaeon]
MSKVGRSISILDSHFFSSAYRALSEGRVVEFRPIIKSESGITYDVFGIDAPEERLRYYLDRGFLEIVDEISLPICPVCGEVCLHPLLLCPDCGSMSIEKKELMAHYDCGYLGPVDGFEVLGPGVYKCPKCGKTMRRIGIDYGRPGFGFTCIKCNSIFQVPLIEVECRQGHRNKIQTLEIKKYPVYRASQEVKKFAAIYQVIKELEKRLSSMGLESESFSRLEGASGEMHVAPLYVKFEPAVIVDVVTEDLFDERYLLGVALKAVDIPDVMILLVLPASLESGLEKIFNPEKVRVIRVNDLRGSINQILDEILALVGMKRHEGS